MPSRSKKRKAAKRKKEIAAAAADHPPLDNGRYDDQMPSDDAKECDAGSMTSSPSSSPRQNSYPPSAEELQGSDSVTLDSSAEGGKGDLFAHGDEENTSAATKEVARATTDESFAESEGSGIESAKSDHEDGKSANLLVVDVSQKIKSERGFAPVCLEEACSEALIKAAPFPGADEAIENLGSKAVSFAEPEGSITELARSDQEPIPADVLVVSVGDVIVHAFLESASDGVQVEASPLPEADQAMEKLDVPHGDCCVASRAEILETTTEVLPSHVPPVVHRTPWWNCCGLLDLFATSRR